MLDVNIHLGLSGQVGPVVKPTAESIEEEKDQLFLVDVTVWYQLF